MLRVLDALPLRLQFRLAFRVGFAEYVWMAADHLVRLRASDVLYVEDLYTKETATVAAAFAKANLPTSLPDGITFDSLAEIMRHDKKQRGGKISFALPCAPGDVRLVPVAV